ncbi:EAL domain-containing protein [Glaciecola siphonariae]|uniref:EAL domain-containing protein n=1 Tax=Glaciecola siphonariae TaxID=521012 RepID=A0ABV9LSY8_9ALTE
MLKSANSLMFICLVAVFLCFSFISPASSLAFNALEATSIKHFRAYPMLVPEGQGAPFARHSQQDAQGFIWITSGPTVQRFDGYDTTPFDLPYFDENVRGTNPYLYRDKNNRFWVGQGGLFYFDVNRQQFTSVTSTQHIHVDSIIEDKNGFLWLAGNGYGIYQYDSQAMEIVASFNTDPNDSVSINTSGSANNSPASSKIKGVSNIYDVQSLNYDPKHHALWIVAAQGVFRFDISTERVSKISTPLDSVFESLLIRDAALDTTNNTLWVGSFRGLLKIDTQTYASRLYTVNDDNNTLPDNHVTTSFIDSNNNAWFGFEKAGMCAYQVTTDTFLCMRAAFDEDGKIPFATVEDINEDDSGNLWLSMNSQGLFRVSPDLEKFIDIKRLYTKQLDDFIPHVFDGQYTEQQELWMATDGGGIAIFDLKNEAFRTLKHDPSDVNSIGANSVISLTQDEFGHIWAGMWSGGLARINPSTMEVKSFYEQPDAPADQTLGGNNVFVVEADLQGGLWMSIWGHGVQYYHFETQRFTNFFSRLKGGNSDIYNIGVVDMALTGDYLYIAGRYGLEQLHIPTGKVERVLEEAFGGISHVYPAANNTLWLGTSSGLVQLDLSTKEYRVLTEQDGLANNEVNFVAEDDNGRIWAATLNGLSVYDKDERVFRNFYEQNGLVSNYTSTHGEFTFVEGKIIVPTNLGANIINPVDFPEPLQAPKTYIKSVDVLHTDESTTQGFDYANILSSDITRELPYHNNSISISFSALGYVFPEKMRYRYRLLGWQSELIELEPSNRSVSFTNLPAGEYVFEVYAANSDDVWDETGSQFTFRILTPWWLTWWFIAAVFLSSLLLIYAAFRWRMAASKRSQAALKTQVSEKTQQLQEYAKNLEQTSNSLADLNSDLEARVQQRTQELEKQVNERREAELKLFHMAFHDSLTGLPNREWLVQLIEKLIAQASKDKDLIYAVMFLDGDRFKQINDTMGHSFGDKLLIACAERLKCLMNDAQHVARLGGDEFTVVTEGMSVSAIEALAGSIVQAFEEPFLIESATVYFNVSVGVVCCDSDYKNVPSVLKNADIAMYHAKASGRSVYKVFDDKMQEQALNNIEIEQGLRDAVLKQEFELVYQPVFSIKDGVLRGFEALLRWHHPEKGLISPADFIPIAEETGLIWDIGAWVLREACMQGAHWHAQTNKLKPSIAINLSSNQLRNTQFLSLLDKTTSESGIDSRRIKLELTESLLIENSHQLETLYNCLQARHIDLAIDDFGTGYSSLAYLNNIPVQFLKIDRSFVAAIDNNSNELVDKNALKILKAIVSLGKSLGKQIVAEGIETELQLNYLKRFGCDMGQGFYLSRPLSKQAASDLLMSHDEQQL